MYDILKLMELFYENMMAIPFRNEASSVHALNMSDCLCLLPIYYNLDLLYPDSSICTKLFSIAHYSCPILLLPIIMIPGWVSSKVIKCSNIFLL